MFLAQFLAISLWKISIRHKKSIIAAYKFFFCIPLALALMLLVLLPLINILSHNFFLATTFR